MGIQANWHLDGLDLPETSEDPLSGAPVIDLSKPEAELMQDLQRHLDMEARFTEKHDAGCDLKWQRDHALMGGKKLSCFSCPHYTADEENLRSVVCWRGQMQEGILGQLDALRGQASLDAEMAAAFEAQVAEYEELAAAVA